MAWAEDPNSPCMYWLNGLAGTGKSTISRTVARVFAGKQRLGASFFFSKGQGDLSNARKFMTTLAFQLAHALPVLMPKICAAVAEHPDIGTLGLQEQWKNLVLKPLLEATELPNESICIVIDALDECENDNDIKLILHLLSEAKSAIRLRVFITSRPETPIRLGIKEIKQKKQDIVKDFVLHNVEEITIRHDIKVFLNYELAKVPRDSDIGEGWPGEDKIELL